MMKAKYGKVCGINEESVRFNRFQDQGGTNAKNLMLKLVVKDLTVLTQKEFDATYTGLTPRIVEWVAAHVDT